MKKAICALTSLFLWLPPSVAQEITVQRTVNSSYEDYLKYLSKNERKSFVHSYIRIASVSEMETPLLEKCLEEIYVGVTGRNTCFNAVKSLTSKPLNQPRREVLFSFLSKIEKSKSAHQALFRSLKQGLLRTHPEMASLFNAHPDEAIHALEQVRELEMKAWRKALVKKFPLQEISLLINGKKVSKLATSWKPPAGSYQWVLVSNTHHPIVRLGSFSQFAAESLKDLKPLATGKCGEIEQLDGLRFGLIRSEVFMSAQCIARFGMGSTPTASPHLGNAASMVQMESASYRHWIWPIIAVVGIGTIASLQNKQVTFQ